MASPTDAGAVARAYAALFPGVYFRFHRRDGKRRTLSGASRAVLLHLAQTGPLTVSECAKHFTRAQSATSEIVEQLEKNGLVARVRDADDRRRTLVWLTDEGRDRIIEEQEVLSRAALEQAIAAMTPRDRASLVASTRALLEAADSLPRTSREPTTNARRRSR